LIELDLNRIRSEQESIVIKHVADGLSPVEWGALETLVTDGGEVSPADIADKQGFHPGSVRRALDRIDDLVQHEYGEVTLRSQHIAELVHEAVQEAKEASRRAVEAGVRAVEAAERGVDETTSALIAFCAKHGIAVDDTRDARLKLRFDDVENVENRLKKAYQLWKDAGKDPIRFRHAQVDLGEKGIATAKYYLSRGHLSVASTLNL
jgi:ParB-like chromosome segregation protein Spo0J